MPAGHRTAPATQRPNSSGLTGPEPVSQVFAGIGADPRALIRNNSAGNI